MFPKAKTFKLRFSANSTEIPHISSSMVDVPLNVQKSSFRSPFCGRKVRSESKCVITWPGFGDMISTSCDTRQSLPYCIVLMIANMPSSFIMEMTAGHRLNRVDFCHFYIPTEMGGWKRRPFGRIPVNPMDPSRKGGSRSNGVPDNRPNPGRDGGEGSPNSNLISSNCPNIDWSGKRSSLSFTKSDLIQMVEGFLPYSCWANSIMVAFIQKLVLLGQIMVKKIKQKWIVFICKDVC